jgi:putative ABC transport system substrate-binding protein
VSDAQPAGKAARVGWLSPSNEPRREFREAMRELGYVEGKTLAFETRNAAGNYDRLPEFAAELVRSKVDIIVAVAPSAVRAAKAATSTIPIVMAFWGGPDLIESGVIANFARPGGNVTGVHMLSSALDPKRLELLVEAVPAAKKIGVLTHDGARFDPAVTGIRKAAVPLGVELHMVDVSVIGYEAAFDALIQKRVKALFVPTSPKFVRDQKSIIELAATRRLPAIYERGSFATDGGLMGYGATLTEMDRQAANFVHRILKGAKAGDLPIEQPTKFELVINLKTAKALGLSIPQSLLARADQVIQ